MNNALVIYKRDLRVSTYVQKDFMLQFKRQSALSQIRISISPEDRQPTCVFVNGAGWVELKSCANYWSYSDGERVRALGLEIFTSHWSTSYVHRTSKYIG